MNANPAIIKEEVMPPLERTAPVAEPAPALAGQQLCEFHKRVAAISARMIKVASEDLDAEILHDLKDFLQPLGLDHGRLLEVSEASSVVKVSHSWFDEGVDPVSGEINLAEHFPWSYQQLVVLGKDVIWKRIEDLPPEAHVDRRTHLHHGTKSALTVPLYIGRHLHFLFSVNTQKAERDWPDEIVEGLRLLGEIIAAALWRRETEQELRFAENRLSLAAVSADAGFWALDLESGVYWATDKTREMFGFPPMETLTREHSRQVIHPDDWGMVQETIARAVSSGEEADVEYRAILPNNRTRWMQARGRIQRGLADGRLRLMGITQDVTARKQMELQLQEQFEEISRLRLQLEEENAYLRNEAARVDTLPNFSGSGQGMQAVMAQIAQVARTDCTVLILGETGTGKELVAQNLHRLSERGRMPMVKVNCAALPAALVESELFGREKGAFTGALSRQVGRFELANGSTLLLDEIAEMPLETQSKLLRVLQEGEFERLGCPRTIKVDVRVLAATNRDLEEEVKLGRFRRDLYYRLNVFPIYIPPLRERRDDIPQIIWEFVNEFNERMGKKIRRIVARDMEMLKSCPWPGNIRELRNVIEHALIVSKGEILELPHNLQAAKTGAMGAVTLEEVERQHIRTVLHATKGRIKGPDGAAQRLGLKPSTLYSRMDKLGLQKDPS